MSLSSLLKKGSLRAVATATPATFATHAPYSPPTVATVATVAVANTPERAANDPGPTSTTAVANVDLIPQKGDEALTSGTIRPPGLSARLLTASLALDAQIQAAGLLLGNDAERWCFPTTPAMPGRDADTFTARVIRFTSKGMSLSDGEALANKLATRDRELDDRLLCLECTHLAGYGAGPWSCRAWSRAGIAIKARDAGLPGDLVQQLQRCDGFTHALNISE